MRQNLWRIEQGPADPYCFRRTRSGRREPKLIIDTGLSSSFIEALICKHLAHRAAQRRAGGSPRRLVCPYRPVDDVGRFAAADSDNWWSTSGRPLSTITSSRSQSGGDRAQARSFLEEMPAERRTVPVPLLDYVISVEAQSITAVAPKRLELIEAFRGISVEPKLLASLGPAVNSGAGMFLYGAPGNGKSTLAKRITSCFGQQIWIPHAIIESGQLIKYYDAAFHRVVERYREGLLAKEKDARWLQIWRPTVVVGGELTMDRLGDSPSPRGNISEAAAANEEQLRLPALDDFGRQRIAPDELLNRWIVPLECRHDFLTLANGKEIQVPFEQLIIFSTNLEPDDLVDEAFLRRIPYKIEVGDPSAEEFHYLFRLYCESMNCEYRKDVVNYLLDTHYRPKNRAMRRCHPRDLLSQIRSLTRYQDVPLSCVPNTSTRLSRCYFAMVLKERVKGDK